VRVACAGELEVEVANFGLAQWVPRVIERVRPIMNSNHNYGVLNEFKWKSINNQRCSTD
jgi:hypothetical protein